MQDWQPALEAHRDVLAIAKRYPDIPPAWLYDRYMRYGAGATAPSLVAFDHQIEDLVNADTLTLSHEMMDLAQHALQSFDRQEPATHDEFLVESGFLYLPEPFTTYDRHHKKVCWRACQFRLVPDMEVTHEGGEKTHEWGLRILLYSNRHDPDDYPLGEEIEQRAGDLGMDWGIAHATAVPLRYFQNMDQLSNEGDPAADWLFFIRVVLRLMQETIVVRRELSTPRAQRRDAQRVFDKPISGVNVIELRRPTERSGNGEGGSANFSHRFIVRGHFRKGHWRKVRTKTGPQDRYIRQTWVGAYEKGPDDLPLIIKERVWVWDR